MQKGAKQKVKSEDRSNQLSYYHKHKEAIKKRVSEKWYKDHPRNLLTKKKFTATVAVIQYDPIEKMLDLIEMQGRKNRYEK